MDISNTLLVDNDDGIVRLRFNRPDVLNAVNPAMALDFREACRDLASDRDVRVVVMSGEGRAFMAGGDLASMKSNPSAAADNLIGPLHEGLQLLAKIDAPVIASVHGPALGAGLSLMLAADFVVAANDARFGLAHVNVGASCDVGASWSLPRMVGLRKALEIALLGDAFDADEALRLGLINRVVATRELASETERLARRLADGPRTAIGCMRRLMRQSFNCGLKEQLDAEETAFRACAATPDFPEALNAFFEKRKPDYARA